MSGIDQGRLGDDPIDESQFATSPPGTEDVRLPIVRATAAARRLAAVLATLGMVASGLLICLVNAPFFDTLLTDRALAAAAGTVGGLLGLAGCCGGFVVPLRRHRRWAAIALTTLGGLATTAAVAALAVVARVAMATGPFEVLLLPTLVAVGLLAGGLPLAVHAFRSVRAIDEVLARRDGRAVGFELIMEGRGRSP